MPPQAIAQALLWLATDHRAPALAKSPEMIELQALVKQYQLT